MTKSRGTPGWWGKAWQTIPSHLVPSRSSWGAVGQPQPWAVGTSLGTDRVQAGTWACGWAHAWQDLCPGRAEPWRAGDWLCCSTTGAWAGGPRVLRWGPGPWAGWAGTGKAGSAFGQGQKGDSKSKLWLHIILTSTSTLPSAVARE